MVGLDEPHAACQAQPAPVDLRDLERAAVDVDGIDTRTRKGPGHGQPDAAATRADIQQPGHAARIDPRCKLPLDQLGERRTRDQYAFVHVEAQAGEPRLPREIREWHALRDAPLQQCVDARELFGRRAPLQHLGRRLMREPHDMEDQRGGFVVRVIRAMSEEHAAAAQAASDAVDQLASAPPAPGMK